MRNQPKIDAYEFGCIEIDSRAYVSDVIILPTGVEANWRRAEGHTLAASDLTAVLKAAPRVLLIGQGAYGQMRVPDETLRQLEAAGIEVTCAPTGRAVEIYNARLRRGEPVAAALHLTC